MSFALLLALLSSTPAEATEKRCGWLHNPTPANWWLTDRHGDWILAVQGGLQVPGMDSLPDMSTRGWVTTNAGSYGYGCACMELVTVPAKREVKRIVSATPLPLRQCRRDRRLPKP